MKYPRTFATPDGESHFEDVEGEVEPTTPDGDTRRFGPATGTTRAYSVTTLVRPCSGPRKRRRCHTMDKGGPPPQPLTVRAERLLPRRYQLPRSKHFPQAKLLNFAAGRHRELIHTLHPFGPE